MLGLLLVGLVGLVVVAVGMPLVLWSLSMETLRERATEAQATPSSRLSLVSRTELPVFATQSRTAA